MRLVSSECRRALILYRRYQAWLKRRAGTEPPNVRVLGGTDVRYWPKADIAFCAAHVRFWEQSGHQETH
jgi:hypothetical protein